MTEVEDDPVDRDIVLRNYQVSLIDICSKNNSIIFLPTGSGKTEIAIAIIKTHGAKISGKLRDGAKRILFMAPTKELARQQTKVLGEKTPFKVCKYTGDDGVDFWPKSKWMEELDNREILIMTPAVMDNLLTHGITTLDIFTLIVIDECHNGVKDHAIRQVMKNMKNAISKPSILGLTATLLNRKTSTIHEIQNELLTIETTFHAKIATCDELGEVLKYSAQPKVVIIKYTNTHELPSLEPTIRKWKELIKIMDEIDSDIRKHEIGYDIEVKMTWSKMADRIFCDIEDALHELGVYGASVTAQYHLLQMLQKECRCRDERERNRISFIANGIHLMRSELMRAMNDEENYRNILKHSSVKISKLLELFETDEDNLTIIFTDRRTTAIVLSHILRILSSGPNSSFQHVKATFCVGGNANPNTLSENLLQSKWRLETFREFSAKEKNTMVTTSILEEGIDLPECNRVIRFDHHGLSYRSFIQSKGRARSQNGVFYVLVNTRPINKRYFKDGEIDEYLETESNLYKMLMGKDVLRVAPTQAHIKKSLYRETIAPFYPTGDAGSHVTGISAIPCIVKYCAKLPQDAFSCLAPIYFTEEVGEKLQVGWLRLPMVSPLRKLLRGPPMSSKKMAKRAVFLGAVKLLYEMGELTDDLQPRVIKVDSVQFQWLFPNYKNETLVTGNTVIGGKNRRQLYEIEYPTLLSGCEPEPCRPCYLHVIVLTPYFNEEPTSNRNKVFKQLLSSSSTYALLSKKKLPSICDFPLFLKLGEVYCHLQVDKTVLLDSAQLERLALYHLQLFSYVIPCAKDFLMMSNESNDFFIVPVIKKGNEYNISWNIVNDIENLCRTAPPNLGLGINKTSFNNAVVAPFYRANEPELYVVTDVCDNITPCSTFPDGQSDITYLRYYSDKYGETISNPRQPLLEVKRLPLIKHNFILPRKSSPSGIKSRRKMIADGDDFEEMLVAELCDRYLYPADLWFKAVFLPTILHRISQLVPLVDLAETIRSELNLSPKTSNWAPLTPDLKCMRLPIQESSKAKSNIKLIEFTSKMDVNKSRQVPAAALLSDSDEPVNMLKQMEKVAECDLKYYDEYLKNHFIDVEKVKQGDAMLNYGDFVIPTPTKVLPLFIFDEKRKDKTGPELHQLLAAMTAKSANDVVNLERFEIFGDSFLKYICSYFLFRQYPDSNEGVLTTIKGKLISNRNLLYCGQAKKFQQLIQAQEFIANGDWMPPRFQLPGFLLKRIKEQHLNPTCMHSIYLTFDEQLRGSLNPDTASNIESVLKNTESITDMALINRSLSYLEQKVLSDKGIADSVEALIGVYITSCGIDVGPKLLMWLDILPKKEDLVVKPENLLNSKAPTAKLPESSSDAILRALKDNHYKNLESTLNYSFKDKSYLLQALTHSSYTISRLTDCYQRLEFLGDAVLDFLVTTYIYQEGPDLDPGQITALRSALVNNVTFGSLCVKFGLHRYLLSLSSQLSGAIEYFCDHQRSQKFVVNEAVLLLLEEKDTSISKAVEVPKALGDLFESLAGAIYLDSGNSLQTVWNVFYPLMKNELHDFLKTIPRNPVALLYELGAKINITSTSVDEITIRAKIDILLPTNELIWVYGFGANKYEAKRSAAKIALKKFMEAKASINT